MKRLKKALSCVLALAWMATTAPHTMAAEPAPLLLPEGLFTNGVACGATSGGATVQSGAPNQEEAPATQPTNQLPPLPDGLSLPDVPPEAFASSEDVLPAELQELVRVGGTSTTSGMQSATAQQAQAGTTPQPPSTPATPPAPPVQSQPEDAGTVAAPAPSEAQASLPATPEADGSAITGDLQAGSLPPPSPTDTTAPPATPPPSNPNFDGNVPIDTANIKLTDLSKSNPYDILEAGSNMGAGATIQLVATTGMDSSLVDEAARSDVYDQSVNFAPFDVSVHSGAGVVSNAILQRVASVNLTIPAEVLPAQPFAVEQMRILRSHAGKVEQLDCKAGYGNGTLNIWFQTDRFSVYKPVLLKATEPVLPVDAAASAVVPAATAPVTTTPSQAVTPSEAGTPSQAAEPASSSEPLPQPEAPSAPSPDTGVASLAIPAALLGLVSAAGIFAFRKKK